MKTTLNQIAACNPCKSGWKALLTGLNKTTADDEDLPLLAVLDINGLSDAIWCFRAVVGFDKEKQLFAVFCARQVQHFCKDDDKANSLLDEVEIKLTGATITFNASPDVAAAYAAYAAVAAVYAAVAYADASDARRKMRETQETELRRVLASLV